MGLLNLVEKVTGMQNLMIILAMLSHVFHLRLALVAS